MTIPTSEPARIIAGDTAKWLKTFTDHHAADGWTLSYTLINADHKYSFGAAAQGDSFLITVAASTTAAWEGGTYAYRGAVTKSGEVFTVAQGSIIVAHTYDVNKLDVRSTSAIMLDAVNAALTKTATDNVLEYEIAGRRLKHYDIPGLLALRDKLTAEVARETAAANIANGLGNPGRIQTRF